MRKYNRLWLEKKLVLYNDIHAAAFSNLVHIHDHRLHTPVATESARGQW